MTFYVTFSDSREKKLVSLKETDFAKKEKKMGVNKLTESY